MANIVLGVTGSISAYKACDIVRFFVKAGHEVRVVMTRAATEFITPLTLRTLSRYPVATDMFAEPPTWVPEHISLAQWGQVMLVAPCTANVVAKLSNGIADDLLTATVLARQCPLAVAPAMNEHMWANPMMQTNLANLCAHGTTIIEAGVGSLACGSDGKGRLAEVEDICRSALRLLA